MIITEQRKLKKVKKDDFLMTEEELILIVERGRREFREGKGIPHTPELCMELFGVYEL